MLHHALMAVLSCWFIILRLRARVDCLSTIYYKQSYCSVEKNCKVLVFFFQNNSVNSFFFFLNGTDRSIHQQLIYGV